MPAHTRRQAAANRVTADVRLLRSTTGNPTGVVDGDGPPLQGGQAEGAGAAAPVVAAAVDKAVRGGDGAASFEAQALTEVDAAQLQRYVERELQPARVHARIWAALAACTQYDAGLHGWDGEVEPTEAVAAARDLRNHLVITAPGMSLAAVRAVVADAAGGKHMDGLIALGPGLWLVKAADVEITTRVQARLSSETEASGVAATTLRDFAAWPECAWPPAAPAADEAAMAAPTWTEQYLGLDTAEAAEAGARMAAITSEWLQEEQVLVGRAQAAELPSHLSSADGVVCRRLDRAVLATVALTVRSHAQRHYRVTQQITQKPAEGGVAPVPVISEEGQHLLDAAVVADVMYDIVSEYRAELHAVVRHAAASDTHADARRALTAQLERWAHAEGVAAAPECVGDDAAARLAGVMVDSGDGVDRDARWPRRADANRAVVVDEDAVPPKRIMPRDKHGAQHAVLVGIATARSPSAVTLMAAACAAVTASAALGGVAAEEVRRHQVGMRRRWLRNTHPTQLIFTHGLQTPEGGPFSARQDADCTKQQLARMLHVGAADLEGLEVQRLGCGTRVGERLGPALIRLPTMHAAQKLLARAQETPIAAAMQAEGLSMRADLLPQDPRRANGLARKIIAFELKKQPVLDEDAAKAAGTQAEGPAKCLAELAAAVGHRVRREDAAQLTGALMRAGGEVILRQHVDMVWSAHAGDRIDAAALVRAVAATPVRAAVALAQVVEDHTPGARAARAADQRIAIAGDDGGAVGAAEVDGAAEAPPEPAAGGPAQRSWNRVATQDDTDFDCAVYALNAALGAQVVSRAGIKRLEQVMHPAVRLTPTSEFARQVMALTDGHDEVGGHVITAALALLTARVTDGFAVQRAVCTAAARSDGDADLDAPTRAADADVASAHCVAAWSVVQAHDQGWPADSNPCDEVVLAVSKAAQDARVCAMMLADGTHTWAYYRDGAGEWVCGDSALSRGGGAERRASPADDKFLHAGDRHSGVTRAWFVRGAPSVVAQTAAWALAPILGGDWRGPVPRTPPLAALQAGEALCDATPGHLPMLPDGATDLRVTMEIVAARMNLHLTHHQERDARTAAVAAAVHLGWHCCRFGKCANAARSGRASGAYDPETCVLSSQGTPDWLRPAAAPYSERHHDFEPYARLLLGDDAAVATLRDDYTTCCAECWPTVSAARYEKRVALAAAADSVGGSVADAAGDAGAETADTATADAVPAALVSTTNRGVGDVDLATIDGGRLGDTGGPGGASDMEALGTARMASGGSPTPIAASVGRRGGMGPGGINTADAPPGRGRSRSRSRSPPRSRPRSRSRSRSWSGEAVAEEGRRRRGGLASDGIRARTDGKRRMRAQVADGGRAGPGQGSALAQRQAAAARARQVASAGTGNGALRRASEVVAALPGAGSITVGDVTWLPRRLPSLAGACSTVTTTGNGASVPRSTWHRLMTWNVQGGLGDRTKARAIAAVLDHAAVDVAVLTESGLREGHQPGGMDMVGPTSTRPTHQVVHRPAAARDGGRPHGGVALAVRRGWTAAVREPVPQQPACAAVFDVFPSAESHGAGWSWGGAATPHMPFTVVGVYRPPKGSTGPFAPAVDDVAVADFLEAALDQATRERPVVVMGDFNVRPGEIVGDHAHSSDALATAIRAWHDAGRYTVANAREGGGLVGEYTSRAIGGGAGHAIVDLVVVAHGQGRGPATWGYTVRADADIAAPAPAITMSWRGAPKVDACVRGECGCPPAARCRGQPQASGTEDAAQRTPLAVVRSTHVPVVVTQVALTASAKRRQRRGALPTPATARAAAARAAQQARADAGLCDQPRPPPSIAGLRREAQATFRIMVDEFLAESGVECDADGLPQGAAAGMDGAAAYRLMHAAIDHAARLMRRFGGPEAQEHRRLQQTAREADARAVRHHRRLAQLRREGHSDGDARVQQQQQALARARAARDTAQRAIQRHSTAPGVAQEEEHLEPAYLQTMMLDHASAQVPYARVMAEHTGPAGRRPRVQCTLPPAQVREYFADHHRGRPLGAVAPGDAPAPRDALLARRHARLVAAMSNGKDGHGAWRHCERDDETLALVAPVHPTEVISALRRGRRHAAPGLDGICHLHMLFAAPMVCRARDGEDQDDAVVAEAAEGTSAAGWRIVALITRMVDGLVTDGDYDMALAHTRLTAIPKEGKDSSLPKNMRGLNVASAAHRLMASIVARRLHDWALATGRLPPEALGFVAERTVTDAMRLMHEVVTARAMHVDSDANMGTTCGSPSRSNGWGRDTYLLFADIAKAYDTVNHAALLQLLARIGVPRQLVRVVHVWYRRRTFEVHTAGGVAAPAPLERGLQQGCPASCVLFALIGADLLADLRGEGMHGRPGIPGVWARTGVIGALVHEHEHARARVGGETCPCCGDDRDRAARWRHAPAVLVRALLYADDVMVPCASPRDAQLAALRLQRWAVGFGMRFVAGAGKSQLVAIQPVPRGQRHTVGCGAKVIAGGAPRLGYAAGAQLFHVAFDSHADAAVVEVCGWRRAGAEAVSRSLNRRRGRRMTVQQVMDGSGALRWLGFVLTSAWNYKAQQAVVGAKSLWRLRGMLVAHGYASPHYPVAMQVLLVRSLLGQLASAMAGCASVEPEQWTCAGYKQAHAQYHKALVAITRARPDVSSRVLAAEVGVPDLQQLLDMERIARFVREAHAPPDSVAGMAYALACGAGRDRCAARDCSRGCWKLAMLRLGQANVDAAGGVVPGIVCSLPDAYGVDGRARPRGAADCTALDMARLVARVGGMAGGALAASLATLVAVDLVDCGAAVDAVAAALRPYRAASAEVRIDVCDDASAGADGADGDAGASVDAPADMREPWVTTMLAEYAGTEWDLEHLSPAAIAERQGVTRGAVSIARAAVVVAHRCGLHSACAVLGDTGAGDTRDAGGHASGCDEVPGALDADADEDADTASDAGACSGATAAAAGAAPPRVLASYAAVMPRDAGPAAYVHDHNVRTRERLVRLRTGAGTRLHGGLPWSARLADRENGGCCPVPGCGAEETTWHALAECGCKAYEDARLRYLSELHDVGPDAVEEAQAGGEEALRNLIYRTALGCEDTISHLVRARVTCPSAAVNGGPVVLGRSSRPYGALFHRVCAATRRFLVAVEAARAPHELERRTAAAAATRGAAVGAQRGE